MMRWKGGCFDLVLFSNRFNLVCTAVKYRCTSQETFKPTSSSDGEVVG